MQELVKSLKQLLVTEATTYTTEDVPPLLQDIDAESTGAESIDDTESQQPQQEHNKTTLGGPALW